MRRKLLATICGLMLAWPLAAAGPVVAADPLGTAFARNQLLRHGCHEYPFSYRVNPPARTTTWSAEVFLIGPRGNKLGSAYFLSPADAERGKSAWRLCRPSITSGKYKMKMKVTFIDTYDTVTARVKPTTFRLKRR